MIKKRKKASRFRASHTHGRGFKKKARGSGHRGGVGMAGTGKRGDQKKTLVLNKFGPFYFGKDRAIRRKISEKLTPINLLDIDTQFETFVKKGKIKSQGKDAYEANFKGYKILSEGELTRKVTLTASAASKKAVEKVKKNGGELIVA